MSAPLTSMDRPSSPLQAKWEKAVVLVCFLGILLRVVLATVNLEANDNHIEVISVIADENRIPTVVEFWEAFQPKFYHVTVAVIWRALSISSPLTRIRVAQLLSCAAGIVTLWIALVFIRREAHVSAKVCCLSFTLIALNPGLIGINAQATNDSFVILAVTLALFFGYRFFARLGSKDFCWMTLSAVLAGISKGNGLVVFLAILGVFAVACVGFPSGSQLTRHQVALYGAIFLVAYLAVVPMVGSYWELYRRYGSPFATPILVAPFPKLFEKSFVYKPGVTSIADSFLTFRLYDLLRNPVSSIDGRNYPLHRTSLWSQLYGRAHFAHFDPWPPSWQLPSDDGRWITSLMWMLGRLIFLCALFPTVLLIVAIGRRSVAALRWLTKLKSPQPPLQDWLLDLAVFGYIAFIVAYSLRLRDYAAMKAIFIFPGLLGFLTLFARDCDKFYKKHLGNTRVRLAVDTLMVALPLFYTADVIALIGLLALKQMAW
jgi:Dolichyl-phosphate-mannose-protein mannosyltransferase